ncbi:tetratricopeptide repeat protein [Cytophagia bacterium CHB2]|nr:tetratricopeptide repeat protein [Cytophagia bacterium CHB2]
MNTKVYREMKMLENNRNVTGFTRRIRKTVFVMIVVSAALLLAACAGGRSQKSNRKARALVVPAGVDSSVARQADSTAKMLFVEYPQQQKAKQISDSAAARVEKSNRLWELLEGRVDSTAVDSIAAISSFNTAGLELKRAVALDKQAAEDPAPEELRRQSLQALETARAGFELSLQHNPFDATTRLWLARTYQLLARRFLDDKNHRKAAATLESLVRVQKDQHGLYARLADCYFALKEYQPALENFQQAERVLTETAVFGIPPNEPLNDRNIAAATDSSQRFLYLYYQGECHIKMRTADSAQAVLERALTFAQNPQNREAAQANLKWLAWDDGNIIASETRDAMLELVNQQKYEEAAKGLERLLPNLKTRRARHEMSWRLATLEFNHLNKPDKSLHMMQAVVKETNTDADSMSQKFRDSYGAMCFNQGQQMLAARKFTTALAYFQQSAEIDWNYRAKSYLELARLAANDPKRAEEFARQALASAQQLDPKEEITVHELLTQALKRQGKFEEARRQFERYRELVSGQRQSN